MELQKKKIQLANPARQYLPNGKIAEFIQLVGKNDHFICLISAANGVGKTACGCNIIANICYGSQSSWFQFPLFEHFPYPKQGRIISDPKTIEQTLAGGQNELEAWLPKGRYTPSKAGRNFNALWKTDTGHSFDVMSLEQDPKEFESKTLGWAWFDEPPTEAIFKATIARMRKGGIIFITMTPLMGSAWIYDQIITKPEAGQRAFITADIEDNCKQHGVRGILEHSHIEKMVAEYSEEEKEARIHGRFQHLVGRVFKKFERRIHVVKPFEVNERHFTVYQAYDPHAQLPDALMWLAVDRGGKMFVIDELFKRLTLDEQVALVRKKEDGHYRVTSRVMDPYGFQPNKQERLGRSLAQVMSEDYGLTYIESSKQRTAGIKLIENAINFQEKEGKLIIPPTLYVVETCTETIKEFEYLTWQERRGRGANEHDPMQKTIDKDDHFVPENLYRILIQNPQYDEYVEPNESEREPDYGNEGY